MDHVKDALVRALVKLTGRDFGSDAAVWRAKWDAHRTRRWWQFWK